MGFDRKTVDLLAGLNRYRNAVLRALNIPVFGSVLKRVMDREGTVFTYIPVYEGIQVDPGTALPITIAEQFIREASHRVLLSYCPCRRAMRCEAYEVNLGCIFLGEGAREITAPEVGIPVGIEQGLNHLHRAVDAGLVPVVGKVKFDAAYLGVKAHHRLMTLCLCCPCCCLAGGIHVAPRDVRDVMVKLEGVEVRTTVHCRGCGTCVEACIFHQIKLVRGRAVIGEECKGCGRCARSCPNGAIEIRVENPEYDRQCVRRIASYVHIGR